VDGTLTVDPASLTITADDATKTYGTTTTFAGTEFTTSGLLLDDTVTSITLASAGAVDTADVGDYAITGSDAVGSGLGNYTITFVDGTLTVDPAALTITADDATKTYGTTTTFAGTEFTTSGLLLDDTVTSITLASAGADAEADVGDYAITGSDAVGSGLGNYTITFADGTLTVDPAALTITADDQSKTYGSTLVFAGTEFSVDGLVNDDTVTSVTLVSEGAAGIALVGDFSIEASDAAGTGLDNYTIAFADGTLTVDPAALVITADDQIKDEGDLFTFDGTEFTTSTLFNGDTVTSVTLASDGADVEALAVDSPFAITASDAVGTGLSNYTISFVDGSMTVEGAAVTEPIPTPTDFGGFPISEVPDVIDVSFPSTDTEGGGGVLGSGAEVSPQSVSPALAEAEETLAVVDDLTSGLEGTVSACDQTSGNVGRYLACLSDALADFAGELDEISNDLPPSMENVAQIVRDAQVKVDRARARANSRLATATTDAERNAIRDEAISESSAALSEASDEIRKSIALVRAEDPELAEVQRSTVIRVADAVDNVNVSLSRATGL
jgi:hypothetical protein